MPLSTGQLGPARKDFSTGRSHGRERAGDQSRHHFASRDNRREQIAIAIVLAADDLLLLTSQRKEATVVRIAPLVDAMLDLELLEVRLGVNQYPVVVVLVQRGREAQDLEHARDDRGQKR